MLPLIQLKLTSKPLALIFLMCCGVYSFAQDPVQYQSHDSIHKIVKEFINTYAKQIHKGDYVVKTGTLDPRLYLKKCNIPLEAFVNPSTRHTNHITVGVSCKGDTQWKIYVSNKITYYKDVIAVRKTLNRGNAIHKSDLYKVRRQINNLNYGYYTEKKQVTGKIASRFIISNTALTPQMLSEPILVHRGQSVVLIAEISGIKVRMTGKALNSGSIGKLVKVRNLSSKRIVEGIVTRTGVVKVY